MVEIIAPANLAERLPTSLVDRTTGRLARLIPAILVAFIGLLLLLPPTARAGTPEKAARDYLAAVKANRVEEVVRAMHPRALKQFRDAVIPVLREADRRGAWPQFRTMFSGARTVNQLQSLGPADFFTAFYRSFGRLNPNLTETLKQSTLTVLGRVDEGKTAHVLYRAVFTLSGRKRSKLSVISFQANRDGWKALLTDEYANLANNLRQALPPGKD